METIDLKQAAETKRKENEVLSNAYSVTLGALVPANFILVIGAALLSLTAGASILIENNLISTVQSGLLALVSGALTIIHSKLGCESYQAECKKLANFHRGLAEDYANVKFVDDEVELRQRFSSLNEQLSAAIKSASALPFGWATSRAEKSVG